MHAPVAAGRPRGGWQAALLWLGSAVLLVLLLGLDLTFGNATIPPAAVWDILTGADSNAYPIAWHDILWQIRLPRAVTAILAGSALGVAGAQLQTWFGNPLAGPSSLGLTAGASLGVAAVVLPASGGFAAGTFGLLGLAGTGLTVVAAALGAAAVLLLLAIAAPRFTDAATLLVAGLMLGNIAFGVVGLWQFFSTPEQLQAFLFWSFGSLGGVQPAQLPLMAGVWLVGMLLALLVIKPLNLLLLGPSYAQSAGLNLPRTRLLVLTCTGLLVGMVTAFCGPIAFVGLAVPHLARGLFRTTDHRSILPASLLLGACLLLACDALALVTGRSVRLPVNLVTALVGAPVVLVLLLRLRSLQPIDRS